MVQPSCSFLFPSHQPDKADQLCLLFRFMFLFGLLLALAEESPF